mmetsp:Transcript_19208/g.48874  ORF Transcript_19208/g.48874 Transcript_19208/m.48874 type:complete len:277 (-) Transcript_19208:737-1567(-)
MQSKFSVSSRANVCHVSMPARAPVAIRRVPLYTVRAGNMDGPGASSMTLEKAYQVLGVPQGSAFEAVLEKKQALLRNADQDRAREIEMAYDTLLMQSMKKRLTGELEVSTSVRYADVPAAPKKSSSFARGASPTQGLPTPSLPKLSAPKGFSLAVQQTRSQSVLATQCAVFAGLATWALLQAVLEGEAAQASDTAGLQLALALGYCLYSLKEHKGMPLGKAAAVTGGCLVAGAVVGNLVEAWLRVDIVPIGAFASPGVLVSEFIMAATAAGAVFLI